MNRYCSHCGFANAENALRCENCKLFVGFSPQDRGISSFSKSRLIIISVVVVCLSLAVYKMFDNSPVAVKPNPTSAVSNSAVESFDKQTLEIQKAETERLQQKRVENYKLKKAKREERNNPQGDFFGKHGCETVPNPDGNGNMTNCY